MIETQLAQIAASLLAGENGKIPGQPEAPIENVSMCPLDGVTRLDGHHALTMQVGTIPQRTTLGMAWWQQFKRIQGSP